MGRKGGKIGGKRRLVTMTPERRKTLRVTPAMQAGVTGKLWSIWDIVLLADRAQVAAA